MEKLAGASYGDVPKWLKGPHSKCGRSGNRREGSNPSISVENRTRATETGFFRIMIKKQAGIFKEKRRRGMIKLVVSDIDGTLLPDGGHDMNPELYEVILKLRKAGMQFAAASGRQWASIEQVFDPI